MSGRIIVGDVLNPETWASIPNGSVHCCVTSPPYWSLRDYGVAGQLGLEPSPSAYVAKMVEAFRFVWKALRDDGTLWLNIGDSYCSSPRGNKPSDVSTSSLTNPDRQDKCPRPSFRRDREDVGTPRHRSCPGLKQKNLVGVPWMLAFALRDDGWYLRQEIIWHKPNPMPESTRDRCTKAHESIFLLTKRPRYYYDQEAIKEKCSPATHMRISQDLANQVGSYRAHGGNMTNGPMKAVIAGSTRKMAQAGSGVKNNNSFEGACVLPVTTRNKRSVWTVGTEPYPGAHFATFPPKLITPCILAGTSAKGCCPECGAPWERVVEKERVRTRPGLDSKVYDRTTGEPVDDDTLEKPWRDRAEIGNRDPGRHISVARTTGWRATCTCIGIMDGRLTDPHTGQDIGTTPVHAKSICLPTVPATVLDPFFGAGTTAVVAQAHGRDWLGIELNPEYAQQAQDRIDAAANPQTWTQADAPADAPLFGGD